LFSAVLKEDNLVVLSPTFLKTKDGLDISFDDKFLVIIGLVVLSTITLFLFVFPSLSDNIVFSLKLVSEEKLSDEISSTFVLFCLNTFTLLFSFFLLLKLLYIIKKQKK
tara:strand:+ start:1295 stop:1621 length:327 start_codon:yes stop_codon:yes gene_type:complete